ncbi:MAG TPA: hypothetical protein VKH19_05935 [Gemmatimonadaceae bacterium]|nr:hypothetical protein [Gemmatimonadaceae bacterium]
MTNWRLLRTTTHWSDASGLALWVGMAMFFTAIGADKKNRPQKLP